VKPAAVLKCKREKKQGEKYKRKVSLSKPPSEELSDSEQSSDSASESSDFEESSSSIESAAGLVPRKVIFDLLLPVLKSTKYNHVVVPTIQGAGKLLYRPSWHAPAQLIIKVGGVCNGCPLILLVWLVGMRAYIHFI
jgi:hypothetical protein